VLPTVEQLEYLEQLELDKATYENVVQRTGAKFLEALIKRHEYDDESLEGVKRVIRRWEADAQRAYDQFILRRYDPRRLIGINRIAIAGSGSGSGSAQARSGSSAGAGAGSARRQAACKAAFDRQAEQHAGWGALDIGATPLDWEAFQQAFNRGFEQPYETFNETSRREGQHFYAVAAGFAGADCGQRVLESQASWSHEVAQQRQAQQQAQQASQAAQAAQAAPSID
jgi:hypothetical protein